MFCYLSRNYKDTTGAGNKAKTDIEKTMEGMGYRNVGLPRSYHANALAHFTMTLLGVLKSPFCIGKGDVLVLQYPLKKYYTFVCNMAHARGAKVVTVIHDLGAFRRKALTVEQEMRRLAHSDCIIAHNDSMKRYLEQAGYAKPIVTLKIFDYLSDSRPNEGNTHRKPFTVVYAGGLNRRKNAFIYDWGECAGSYGIRVYGNGFEPSEAKCADKFKVMGFVKSDELIATAEGDFGLVWDGASLDACTGNWGEYLKINAPHKTSLYLRCGLPIIIWDKAAMAPFVRDNGVGLCVGSLRQLDKLLADITSEEYSRMKENVTRVSLRLSQGQYIREALAEAASMIMGE